MARVWPSHRAGRLTASGPSWRAEDRQEWKKCFEVATHPLTTKPEREKVWIPHLPLRTVILLFSFWRREEKMKWGWGSERGELFRGPGAASGVKERRNFDSLSSGEEKIKPAPFLRLKCANTVEMKSVNSKDKCYRSRLSVRTSHMWFPGRIYHPNLWPKIRGKLVLSVGPVTNELYFYDHRACRCVSDLF